MALKAKNLGPGLSVWWNRHEVAIQFRNQASRSSHRPRRYLPQQLVVVSISLLVYIGAAVPRGIDTPFGRIVSQGIDTFCHGKSGDILPGFAVYHDDISARASH